MIIVSNNNYILLFIYYILYNSYPHAHNMYIDGLYTHYTLYMLWYERVERI